MEVEAITAEVKYSIKVPKLSSYKDANHSFMSDFSLSINGLRTRWCLTLSPLYNKNHESWLRNTEHSSVKLSLVCLKSSMTSPDIDVYCHVLGREEHEVKLERVDEGAQQWEGVLISCLALRIFKLLSDNQLTACLRFVVHGGDLWRTADPLEDLSAQMGELKRSGNDSDIDILTTDGSRIPAHSSILNARSNLLCKAAVGEELTQNTTRVTLQDTKHIKTEKDPPEKTLNSSFGSDMSSGYHSLLPDASCRVSKSPLKPSKVPSDSTICTSPRLVTPRREVPHSPGSKRFLANSRVSPSKRPLFKTGPDLTPPRLKIHHKENYCSAERVSLQASEKPITCDSSSYCLHSPSPTTESPLKEISTQKASSKGRTLRVNMSASVAGQLLDWIYTGECEKLGQLARPLLVAGLRHGVGGLVEACQQHLVATLTPSNTLKTLLLTEKYPAPALRSAALSYAVSKAAEVTSQPSWHTLALQSPSLTAEFSCLLANHVHSMLGR